MRTRTFYLFYWKNVQFALCLSFLNAFPSRSRSWLSGRQGFYVLDLSPTWRFYFLLFCARQYIAVLTLVSHWFSFSTQMHSFYEHTVPRYQLVHKIVYYEDIIVYYDDTIVEISVQFWLATNLLNSGWIMVTDLLNFFLRGIYMNPLSPPLLPVYNPWCLRLSLLLQLLKMYWGELIASLSFLISHYFRMLRLSPQCDGTFDVGAFYIWPPRSSISSSEIVSKSKIKRGFE